MTVFFGKKEGKQCRLMALRLLQHFIRAELMVEKLTAAAAGSEPLKAAAAGSMNQLPDLFVGHCSADHELPFHWSVTIN